MRGPELVGYPPEDLRWSGDSRELFFEWRAARRGRGRDLGGRARAQPPRRLTDEERKRPPPRRRRGTPRAAASPSWTRATSWWWTPWRARGASSRAPRRAEGDPRWARRDTAVTFTRDNGLYVVPVRRRGGRARPAHGRRPREGGAAAHRSQKFLRDEERKLLKAVAEAAEKKKRDEEKKKKAAPPRFEITDKQRWRTRCSSPDDRHAFLLVEDKAEGARVADIPSYVTESAYTESIPRAPTSATRRSGGGWPSSTCRRARRVWASAAFAGPAPAPKPAPSPSPAPVSPTPSPSPSPSARPGGSRSTARCAGPCPSSPATAASRWPRCGRPTTRTAGSSPSIRRPATRRVLDHEHDDAWVRDSRAPTATQLRLPARRPHGLLPVGAHRLDAPLHRRRRRGGPARAAHLGRWEVDEADLAPGAEDASCSPPPRRTRASATSTRCRSRAARARGSPPRPGAHAGVLSPDERTLGLLHSTSQPPAGGLPGRRAARARRSTQVTTSPTPEWRAYPWLDPQLVTFRARDGAKVPARLYTPEMVGQDARPARPP